MTWTGRILIVLALSSLGCARSDWISETLTLVDVTGTWEGPWNYGIGGVPRTTRWVLQQKGARVTGVAQGPDGAPIASIEGAVNGEVLNWQLTGPFLHMASGAPPNRTYRGEAAVNSDELSGRADGHFCPCTFDLRRVNTEAIKEKQQQM